VSNPWISESERVVLNCPPWLTVRQVTYLLPSGKRIDDFWHVDFPDFVMVIPRTAQGTIVLVEAWRPGLGTSSLWAPGGIVDPGESPLNAAKRELAEETGYIGGDWRSLGKYAIDANRGCGAMHLFTARGVVHAPFDPDPHEGLAVKEVTPARVRDGLRNGDFPGLPGAATIALTLALDPGILADSPDY
jgi:ADP-ribose pyrophosphatase